MQPDHLRNEVHRVNLSRSQVEKPDSDSTKKGKGATKKHLGVREERIREAKEKNRRGYYRNPEVTSKIAQRLIDLLGVR
jgi:hypothetical protein